MRIRRAAPQKPLTEEQKQRAIEAQKNVAKIQWPLTQNQMYQTNQSPIPTRWWYPFNKMNRSFMMDKKATFEEKYWVYENQLQQQWTVVEFQWWLQLEPEDDVVPPSLEDDPNQASPLPPDVKNASDEDALDAFIKNAEENAKAETVEIPLEKQTLSSTAITIIENELQQLSVKQLKEEYKNRWWDRNVEYNNNKKNLINLIIELAANGTSQKEDWTAAWQDGSVD